MAKRLRANFVGLRLRQPTRAILREDGLAEPAFKLPPNRQPFAYEIDDPDLPRVVMFRDSFCTALVPFLVEHYRRISFYWTNFQPGIVLHERPELVIEERAERQATRIQEDRG